MTLSIYFVEESPVRIWGLTPRMRIERVLAAAGIDSAAADVSTLHDGDAVLILRADYLIDDRLVNYLAETPDTMLQIDEGGERIGVAAHVPAHAANQALGYIKGKSEGLPMPGIQVQTPETLVVSFQEKLLKFDPPFVLPVSAERRRELERRLFAWSYKGVTDLVTKWAWPLPARWAVGQCVRFGIRPNHVTVASLVLVILAGILFACGQYAWGLLAGWLMTFLDTVDGKLARVTVTSSRFGHYFDHLIDLVHPPIWYILWGQGLTVLHPEGIWYKTAAVLWYIVAGYVAGRLVEGLFQWRLGRFGIFCWRPVDSYFRLVTARRNPNLILLTVSVLAGRPDIGLLAVAFWTVLTSVVLLLRLGTGVSEKIQRGSLKSWFMDADQALYRNTLAARLFTRRAER